METATKKCAKCGRELPVSEFYANKKAKDGLHSYCKECIRERRKNKRNAVKIERKALPKDFFSPASGGGSDNPLSKFTPRELMEELKRRGYRGKLEYTSVIDIENF